MNGYPILWHPGMMLVLVAAAIALGIMAFRFAGRGVGHAWDPHGHHRMGDTLDVLEQRFARGDIGQAEYEAKRTLLS